MIIDSWGFVHHFCSQDAENSAADLLRPSPRSSRAYLARATALIRRAFASLKSEENNAIPREPSPRQVLPRSSEQAAQQEGEENDGDEEYAYGYDEVPIVAETPVKHFAHRLFRLALKFAERSHYRARDQQNPQQAGDNEAESEEAASVEDAGHLNLEGVSL